MLEFHVMRPRFSTIAVLTLTLLSPFSQATPVLSLSEMFELMLTQSTKLGISEANFRRYEAESDLTFGRALPQISMDGRTTRSSYESGSDPTFYNGFKYGINISQVLYDGKLFAQISESEQREILAELQYEAELNRETARLVSAYLDVLAAEDKLSFVKEEVNAGVETLEQIDALYQRQLATRPDLLETEARVNGLKSSLLEAKSGLDTAREALREIIDLKVDYELNRVASSSDLAKLFPVETLEYWEERSLQGSPDILARSAAVDQARIAVDVAESGHYPKLTLQLSTQTSNIGYENAPTRDTTSNVAAINLQFPIYSGGQVTSQTRIAGENLRKAEFELESTRRALKKNTRSAFNGLTTNSSKIEAAQRSFESAEISYQAAEKSFKLGFSNVIDVLNRSKNRYSIAEELQRAKYEYLKNYATLLSLSGDDALSIVQQISVVLERNPNI